MKFINIDSLINVENKFLFILKDNLITKEKLYIEV